MSVEHMLRETSMANTTVVPPAGTLITATGRLAARAIALLDRHTELSAGAEALALRWRVLVVREYALNLQGHRAEQRATLNALHKVADALNDDSRRAFAARRESLLAMRTADHQPRAYLEPRFGAPFR